MKLPDIEAAAKRVHERWVESKKALSIPSIQNERGHEMLVPYEQLDDPSKGEVRLLAQEVINMFLEQNTTGDVEE